MELGKWKIQDELKQNVGVLQFELDRMRVRGAVERLSFDKRMASGFFFVLHVAALAHRHTS